MSAPEHIWAYCEACQDTRPVNGTELREYLTNGTPHSYADLVCAVCYNVVATISIGPPGGSPPVQPSLQIPPRKQTAPPDEERNSPLRRVQRIDLRRDGEHVEASIDDLKGTGDGLSDALRDLARAIERSAVTIWVPAGAKTYTEDGRLKAQCPECGNIKTFIGFSEVIAFICDGCRLGIAVQLIAKPPIKRPTLSPRVISLTQIRSNNRALLGPSQGRVALPS